MELIALIKDISSVCIVLASIAGGIAVTIKLFDAYSENKEFKKKCASYEAQINETNGKVQNAHNFAQEALTQMNCETEAKLQEIRAEQEMITVCMRAVLDGLHQLNCNGKVTEASDRLDEYLNSKAHQ